MQVQEITNASFFGPYAVCESWMLSVQLVDGAVTRTHWVKQRAADLTGVGNRTPSLSKYLRSHIENYSGGDFPLEGEVQLRPRGTEFQLRVWRELRNIPCGQTRTYYDIAVALGDKNLSRAVGNANGSNPIPLLIPCHRVIRKDGRLGGYSGPKGLKQTLLRLEEAL